MNREMHVLLVYHMLITLLATCMYIYVRSSYILVSPPDMLKPIPIRGYYLEEISDIQYPYMYICNGENYKRRKQFTHLAAIVNAITVEAR